MSPILVDRLSHSFPTREGALHVLNNLSFEVAAAEVVTVLGPSGCGKSTLLRCLAGLLSPASGKVSIDGCSPSEMRSKKELGFGFQEPSLMGWRTVEKNISLPWELGKENGTSEGLKTR